MDNELESRLKPTVNKYLPVRHGGFHSDRNVNRDQWAVIWYSLVRGHQRFEGRTVSIFKASYLILRLPNDIPLLLTNRI
jgi:hypothetical protein